MNDYQINESQKLFVMGSFQFRFVVTVKPGLHEQFLFCKFYYKLICSCEQLNKLFWKVSP